MEDYYRILGVEPDATPEAIQERFRFLAMAFHPDRHSDLRLKQRAEEETKKINEAYTVLSDTRKRADYDLKRRNTLNYSKANNYDMSRKDEEAARKKANEEIRKKAEEAGYRRAREEQRIKAEEAAHQKARAEQRIKTEEAARQKARAEQRIKTEEAARQKKAEVEKKLQKTRLDLRLKGKNKDLRDLNLEGLNLANYDLRNADLRKVNLVNVDLSGANLSGADLCEANLNKANLRNAFLTKANLKMARFNNVDLSDADLSGADLRGAFLGGSTLTGVDLRGANLRWTFFMDAKLISVNLHEATYNTKTVWPKDFSPENTGAVLKEEKPSNDESGKKEIKKSWDGYFFKFSLYNNGSLVDTGNWDELINYTIWNFEGRRGIWELRWHGITVWRQKV